METSLAVANVVVFAFDCSSASFTADSAAGLRCPAVIVASEVSLYSLQAESSKGDFYPAGLFEPRIWGTVKISHWHHFRGLPWNV